jgi:thiamine-phosphate pyrophosphorylase
MPSLLQYRNKPAVPALRREQAAALLEACRAAGVPLIVNDDVALAAELGADGVHLGEHDGDLAEARGRWARARCSARPATTIPHARAGGPAGADYVAFGAFHPSPTKPGARRATPALLRATAGLGLPRVAIGGITPDNAAQLVAAGADLVAVLSGVFDAPDPTAAARAIQACSPRPD